MKKKSSTRSLHVAEKTAFRTWKSGKNWLFAAATTLAIAGVGSVAQGASANVTGTLPNASQAAQVSSAAASTASQSGVLGQAQSSAPVADSSVAASSAETSSVASSSVNSTFSSAVISSADSSTASVSSVPSSTVSADSSANTASSGPSSITSSAVSSLADLTGLTPAEIGSLIDVTSSFASAAESSAVNAVGSNVVASSAASDEALASSITSEFPSMDPSLAAAIALAYENGVTSSGVLANTSAEAIALGAATSGSSTATPAAGILDTTLGDVVNQLISSIGISGIANLFTQLSNLGIPGMSTVADMLNSVQTVVDAIGNIQDIAKAPGAWLNSVLQPLYDGISGLTNLDPTGTLTGIVTDIQNAVAAMPGLDPQALLNWMENPTLDIIPGMSDIMNTLEAIPIVGPMIQGVVNGALSTIGSVTQGVVNQLNSTISGALGGTNFDLSTMLGLTGNDLLNYVTGLVANAALNYAGQALWALIGPIVNQIPLIGNYLAGVLGPILGNLSNASLQQLLDLTGLSGIIDTISNALSSVGNFISGIWNNLQGLLSGAWNLISGIVNGIGNIFSGIGSWISDAWNSLVNTIGNIVNNIWDWINGLFGGGNSSAAVAPVIATKNVTIAQGGSWTAADTFVSATDSAGKSVALSNVKVYQSVDVNTPGTYQVTYTYTDAATGLAGTGVATVTVLPASISTPTINAHDSTVTVGTAWTAASNFDSANDSAGNSLSVNQVLVNSNVDTSKVGSYQVTYSYTDPTTNQVATKTVTVTVVAAATTTAPTVLAKNSTLSVGATWSSADNFISATDSEGNAVNFSNVTVTGTVDTTTAGTYTVTYSYKDAVSGLTGTATATIVVVATPVAVAPTVNAHNSTVANGSTWTPADNFDGATDSEGNAISLSSMTVTGTVNTAVAGSYNVTYSYTDATTGLTGSKTIVVTVAVPTAAAPDLHATEAYIYNTQQYHPNLNFMGGTDSEGNKINMSQVTYTLTNADGSPANLGQSGDYTVTFSYTDPTTGLTGTATSIIHVKKDNTSVVIAP